MAPNRRLRSRIRPHALALCSADGKHILIPKLLADTVRALQDPDVRKKFGVLRIEAVSSTAQEFVSWIRAEQNKYSKLIKEAGIKVDKPCTE